MEGRPLWKTYKMAGNNIHILSTRPLSAESVREAANHHILIDTLSFIETEAIDTIEVQQEIENALLQSAMVIFTSMNAVQAVADQLEGQEPDWKIYTMGNTSAELVKEYFGEELLSGTANNATELAELVAEEWEHEEVIFFCGNQRRDELPDILRQHHIDVNEIEVYTTITTPHKIRKHYDGILFFSPSAVRSFFSVNKTEPQTILFAIGETTAGEIGKYSKNRILTGSQPGKENLLQEAIEFFEGN